MDADDRSGRRTWGRRMWSRVVGESRGGGVEVAEGVRVERETVGEEVGGVLICGYAHTCTR
mgnify:CR=1 FL=1